MKTDQLSDYYEGSADRFWDARVGLAGRDVHIYPLLDGCAGTLLEYGCGGGSLLLNLALESRFTKCIGVDISAKALATVERSWAGMARGDRGKVELMQPDEDRLPKVADKSVDVIVSLATIEHIVNPYIVLDELYRVAADDAVLVACVPNYGYIKHVAALMLGRQPRTGTEDPVENWRRVGWDGMHLHTFTKSSFGTLLERCGWLPQRWSGWGGTRFDWLGLAHLRRRFPGVLSTEVIAVCRRAPHPPAEAGHNRPALVERPR